MTVAGSWPTERDFGRCQTRLERPIELQKMRSLLLSNPFNHLMLRVSLAQAALLGNLATPTFELIHLPAGMIRLKHQELEYTQLLPFQSPCSNRFH